MASGPIRGVNRDLKNLNSIAGRAGKGVGTAALNLKRIGIAGAAGIAVGGLAAIKSGLDSLAERENVISATEAAIKATGGAAKVSAAQVRGWSEALETATGAAVDDKEIQAAATTIIRFGAASEKSFERTLAAATDLGVGMKKGPEAGAVTLSKALADPAKAMGVLRKAGILLSDAEEARIKKLVKQNKVQEAQGVILAAVEKRYKGAAAASAGPYTRALNLLADASEDAKMALAEGFLPILTKVAGKLSTAVADPKVIASIREIGTNLAGGFDKALSAAEKIPWGTIGDSMKLAGAGAKAAFDLFTGLPPWVQTAVLTGWGLNKLTGGALTGIAGELGKGLIKGVLGMNAGVVNIKAGVVTGAGGPGGVAAGPGAGGKLLQGASNLLLVGTVAALASEFSDEISGVGADLGRGWRQAVDSSLGVKIPTISPTELSWPFGPKNTPTILPQLGGNGLLGGNGAPDKNVGTFVPQTSGAAAPGGFGGPRMTSLAQEQVAATNAVRRSVESSKIAGVTATSAAASRNVASLNAVREKAEANRIATAAGASKMASAAALAGTVAKAGGLAAASAIRAKDLSVTTTFSPIIKTYVSVRETINTQTTYRRFQRTAS